MNRFRVVMGLAALSFVVGCAFGPHRFNPSHAESYVKRHPDLPGRVVECLLAGRLSEGMTKQAVRICMGSPDVVERVVVSGERCDVWEYTKPALERGELRGSEMWTADVPLARVRFGADGSVVSFRRFAPHAGSARQERSVQRHPVPHEREKTVVPSGAPLRRKTVVNSTLAPAEPQANRIPADWPELKLSGVSVGADAPYAIINRQLVAQGEQVMGVTLLYVKPDGVYLKLDESILFLTIGKALGK
jgi:hypothetical protein